MARRKGTVVHGAPRKRTVIKGVRSSSGPWVPHKPKPYKGFPGVHVIGKKLTPTKVRGRKKR